MSEIPAMAFFALPYRVLFHDTMAYGSHHHMTNLKFQNIARETLIFNSSTDGGGWRDQLEDILMLTREAFSFNLAPVALGEKVAVLLTYEDPSRSSVRLCFRVVREDGRPVSFGYQTLIMVDRETQQLVPAPRLLTQYLDPAVKGYSLLEPLVAPGFGERARGGSLAAKSVFSDAVVAIGRHVANAELRDSYPRVLDEELVEYPL